MGKYGHKPLNWFEAIVNKLGGEEGADRFLRNETEVVEKVKLLKRVSTIELPAVKDFIAADHFVVDTSEKAKVKISYLGDNFRKYFLPKKETGEVAAEELTVNELLEDAYDPAIVTDLGGEEKVEISLGQFFAMFAKQPNGESGQLLTNGRANIGYIRGDDGVLWTVHGRWNDDGWVFEASPLDNPYRWYAGYQVLSR